MAYEKQTWNTGDTITAQKLNHMEDGIATGGGVAYLTLINTGVASDIRVFGTPFDELYAALNAHKPFVCNSEVEDDVSVPCRYTYGTDSQDVGWIAITIDNVTLDTPDVTLFGNGNGYLGTTPVTYTYNTTTCEYEFTVENGQ